MCVINKNKQKHVKRLLESSTRYCEQEHQSDLVILLINAHDFLQILQ